MTTSTVDPVSDPTGECASPGSLPCDSVSSTDFVLGETVGAGRGHCLVKLGRDLLS